MEDKMKKELRCKAVPSVKPAVGIVTGLVKNRFRNRVILQGLGGWSSNYKTLQVWPVQSNTVSFHDTLAIPQPGSRME